MIDRILENPLSFASGCLIWIPLTIWILMLVYWIIGTEIDALSGLAGIGVAIGMGIVSLQPPHPVLPPLLFVGATSSIILLPIARGAFNRAAHKAIEFESMERAYQQLGLTPNSVGSKFRIAQVLYSNGHAALAAAIGEQAIHGLSRQHYADEYREVQKWKSASREQVAKPVTCIECSHVNPVGTLFCEQCGAPYLLAHAKGSFIAPDLKKKLVASWLVGMLVLIGIPLAATALPAGVALAVILAILLGGALTVRFAYMRS
jgi:hypothetical protein